MKDKLAKFTTQKPHTSPDYEEFIAPTKTSASTGEPASSDCIPETGNMDIKAKTAPDLFYNLDKNKYNNNYYKVKEIKKVYDGDTITVTVDLGLETIRKVVLRLADINTPEIRGKERPEGLLARDYVRNLLFNEDNPPEIWVNIKSRKGKYGRYIAYFYVNGKSLNELLVKEGHAVYVNY